MQVEPARVHQAHGASVVATDRGSRCEFAAMNTAPLAALGWVVSDSVRVFGFTQLATSLLCLRT